MNYLEWNSAIIKHFFNQENEDKEVMLYFSEPIIEEIGVNNFPKPEDGYIEDFYNALRRGVLGIQNDNYIERILNLEQKYRDGCRKISGVDFEYPPYLTYLIAFILPFTSSTDVIDCNANNFHTPVKDFFEYKKALTSNYDKIIRGHLSDIDGLWLTLSNWLFEDNNCSLGYIEEINPPGNRSYVGKIEYHILFRKEQEERLSMVFDKNEILPGEAISEEKIRKLIIANSENLKLSTNTRKRINDNNDYIGGKIVKRALSFYKNWDGVNHTIEGKRGFSRNRLVLCLDFNSLNKKINLKYFRIFTKNGIPEHLKLEKRDGTVLTDDIYQINSSYSNPVEKCFIDLNTEIQLVDSAARDKYSWKKADFHIFKKISNFDWVEIPRVEYNVGKTLVICKKMFYENDMKHWFEGITDNKTLLDNNNQTQLPNDWIALTIDSITKWPHSTIQELIPDREQKPKINFDKSFYIEGKLFKDMLPTVWLENTEIQDDIIAKYEDGSEIKLDHLNMGEEGINQFSFTSDHINREKLNQPFKLVCKDISTQRFLKITSFLKRSNSEIEILLPKRDVIGQLTLSVDNYFKGIEHFFSPDIINKSLPFQNQLNTVFHNQQEKEGYLQNNEYDTRQLGNLLIHYISSKGQLGKQEFNDAVFSLLKNDQIHSEDIKKAAVRLGYLLQEQGYVDYDYDKSKFYINKPHLIVIPVAAGSKFNLIGARDAGMIKDIINYCKQKTFITIEILTNKTNKLQPQTINLHLRECNQELVKDLVNEFGIIFKKENLFTQFALTSCFPDISEWKKYIKTTSEFEIQDIEGGYLFDIETLKFVNKQESFDRELTLVKFTNINGYKTVYRLWYKENCYNIPEQQLGIYLYLYLYKKIRDDKFEKCKKEKGWANCSDELEAKENAQIKTNILVYDRDNKLLAVPFYCRLPRYFSASFQLLSDQAPIIKTISFEGIRYTGMYYIYQNIPNLFLTNILNSRLLKRELNNPIFNKTIIL